MGAPYDSETHGPARAPINNPTFTGTVTVPELGLLRDTLGNTFYAIAEGFTSNEYVNAELAARDSTIATLATAASLASKLDKNAAETVTGNVTFSGMTTLPATVFVGVNSLQTLLDAKLDKAGSNPHGDYTVNKSAVGNYEISFASPSILNLLSNSVNNDGRYTVLITTQYTSVMKEACWQDKTNTGFKVKLMHASGGFVDKTFDFACFYDGKCFCHGTVSGPGGRLGFAP